MTIANKKVSIFFNFVSNGKRMDHKTRVPYDYVYECPAFPLAVMPRFGCSSPGPHTHEGFLEIVLIVSGEAEYTCESKRYTLRSQEIIVTLPGMRHNYEQCSFDYYNILVDFDALGLPLCDLDATRGYQDIFVRGPHSHLGDGEPFRNFLDVGQFAASVGLLKKMTDLRNRREPGFRMAMLACFAEFLRVVCRAGEPGQEAGKNADVRLDTIGEVALAMIRRCQENWSVERLCRTSNLSRPVLFREFKKYYHTSPNKFLMRQRLRKARALLESSELPVEAVATQCGFASASYFATAFAHAFGVTPLQYRREPFAGPDVSESSATETQLMENA